MFSIKSRVYVVILGLSGLVGCSGDEAAKKPITVEPLGKTPYVPEPIRPARGKDEKVKEVDVNRDYKPDLWTYTVEGKNAEGQSVERVVRKEIDLNGDGTVDMTQYYDAREEKVRESLDQDFDGKVDSVLFFEKGVNIRTERDVDGNGQADVWLYYEKGKLARKERDTNADGKVDKWEYWEGGQVDRIGDDMDGDGNVDRWTKNPNSQ